MIGIIVNLRAAGCVDDPDLPRRLSQIGGRRVVVHPTRDLEQLRAAIQDLRRRQVQVIATCGGDGTNRAVLSEAVREYGGHPPRLAILRGGAVNTVAGNLHLHGRPDDLLWRLLAARRGGGNEAVERRRLLRVNDDHGFIFTAAMGARFFESYLEGGRPGPRSAASLAARITLSSLLGTSLSRRMFRPVSARITADGRELPCRRWTLLVAATVLNVGLQVRITCRALEAAGRYHLVASGLPPGALARQFHRTFLSRSLSGPTHFDLLARETVIEFEREEPFVVDGDLFHARRVVLESGPGIEVSTP